MKILGRAAVFVENYGVDYSPSILNIIRCLAEVGSVDVFFRDVHHVRSSVLRHPGVRVIHVVRPQTPHRVIQNGVRLVRATAKAVLTGGRSLPRRLDRWATPRAVRRSGGSRYRNFLCFDGAGLLLCKEIFPAARPVYYSLELDFEGDPPDIDLPAKRVAARQELLRRERQVISEISGLVIQSEERELLFKEHFGLNHTLPTFHLPVTYDARAVRKRRHDVHHRHGLSEEICVALHLGGMNYWYGSLEVAEAFSALEDWRLLFQGNHQRKYLQEFSRFQENGRISNAIVSRRFFDDLGELDEVVASCDMGIAWYEDLSKNLSTAGKSSGKIAAYLRFGLPIVAKRYPSTVDAIERTGCGLCVESYGDIPNAVRRIERDFPEFRRAALTEYERTYDFSRYRSALLHFFHGVE